MNTKKSMAKFKQQKVNDTIQEAKNLLSTVRKCLIIRPTGFGKTYSITKISKDYDKVYYFYPRDIIEQDVINKYPSVSPRIKAGKFEFISYMKIVSMAKDKRLQLDFQAAESQQNSIKILFILDETHLAGAPQTRKALLNLFSRFPNAYYLGASATPERMDGTSIATDFFDDYVTSKYDIEDAINDGIFPKPLYIPATYDINENLSTLDAKIKKMVFTDEEIANKVVTELTSRKLQYSKLANVENILQKHIGIQPYMKFICFFPTQNNLFSKRHDLIKWFQTAFPSHKVQDTIVISTNQYKDNIIKIQHMQAQNDTIDLILCVDMLNMGYHVDDLDGVVMLRATQSDTIYKQQIGRCISISSQKIPVIFDWVGNCDKFQNGYMIISQQAKSHTGSTMNLGSEHLVMKDYIKDFLDISRICDYFTYPNTSTCLDAYVNKFAPIDWAMKSLKISNILEFQALLQIEGFDLRDSDKIL